MAPDGEPTTDATPAPSSPPQHHPHAGDDEDPRGLAAHIGVLAGQTSTPDGLLKLMRAVALTAVARIPQVDWAGVTVRFYGHLFTCAHTDQRVLILDEGQYATGNGPCLESITTHRRISVGRAELDLRWPHLNTAADRAGVRSVFACPVFLGPTAVAALNLYSRSDAAFTAIDEAPLSFLCHELGRAITTYTGGDLNRPRATGLLQLLHEQSCIALATGMLIAREQLDETQARTALEQRAALTGSTLADYCEQLIHHI